MIHDLCFQFCGTSSAPAFQRLYRRLIRYIWVFVIFILTYLFHTKCQCKCVLKLGSMAIRLLILRALIDLVTPHEKECNAF